MRHAQVLQVVVFPKVEGRHMGTLKQSKRTGEG